MYLQCASAWLSSAAFRLDPCPSLGSHCVARLEFFVIEKATCSSLYTTVDDNPPVWACDLGIPAYGTVRHVRTQGVRIPKALAFDSVDIEVVIERRGDELIVRPARRRLTGLGAAFRRLAPHFRGFVREQPDQDRRDWTPARVRQCRYRGRDRTPGRRVDRAAREAEAHRSGCRIPQAGASLPGVRP